MRHLVDHDRGRARAVFEIGRESEAHERGGHGVGGQGRLSPAMQRLNLPREYAFDFETIKGKEHILDLI